MLNKELKKKIGQMFMVGFDGKGFAGDLKTLVEKYHVAGAILFARNISEVAQVWELTRILGGRGVLVAVDHEGGRVHRFSQPVTKFPPAATIGRLRSAESARKVYAAMGTELKALGFHLSFAPVLDILAHPGNQVIGDRSFGATADVVSEMGGAAVKGLHEAGILACGKHFPGHGSSQEDSHLTLPPVPRSERELEQEDMRPFRDAIQAGLRCIMPGHLLVRALDPRLPASLSPVVIGDWLRRRLGFSGVVFSDDMEMKGVASGFDVEDRTLLSIQAGVDVLLYCSDADAQMAAIETVYKAVEGRIIREERIVQSAERIQRIREWAWRTTAAPTLGDLMGRLNDSQHKALAASLGG